MQDAEKTTEALWTSSVEVFEAGAVAALPMINIAGAVLSKPVVHFSSHGPVISTMTGADAGVVGFLKADLKDDGTTAAITFRISDNDSALKDVKLTAAVDKAGAKLVTGMDFLDPKEDLYTIVLTVDQEPGVNVATITITATDEHKNVRKRTFKFELTVGYSAFWVRNENACAVSTMIPSPPPHRPCSFFLPLFPPHPSLFRKPMHCFLFRRFNDRLSFYVHQIQNRRPWKETAMLIRWKGRTWSVAKTRPPNGL